MSSTDYTIEDLLLDTNTDLENIESELMVNTDEDLQNALEEASRDLKHSLEKLAKSVKKEIRSEVLDFYHDNRKLINSDLKSLNSVVKDILAAAKEALREEIQSEDDQETRKELKAMRDEVVRFSRRYNHHYHKLRLKLALGNAGVSIKNLFH